MLDYQNHMLLKSLENDSLIICARGLNVEDVLVHMIKIYCDPGNLVLVLGGSADDHEYFIDELRKQSVSLLPRVVTSETSAAEREHVYANGGVLFVSARILVVDLLKRKVPVEHVSGFLVLRAHKILHSCQDVFALRLYRLSNKTGFIRGFSCSPEAFVHSGNLQLAMQLLFLREYHVWPRFHKVVQDSIAKQSPLVLEFSVTLTESMANMERALLDIIEHVLDEIKRTNPVLDVNDMNVEHVLCMSLFKLLNVQLDPAWNQFSSRTKQLISDLKILRHLLVSLMDMDSVRYYKFIQSFRSIDYVHRSSGWMMLDAAETFFTEAKKRLYYTNHKNNNSAICPEPHPKWNVLTEIIKEDFQQRDNFNKSNNNASVLVLVKDPESCKILKNYLLKGAKQLLTDLHEKHVVGDNRRHHNKSENDGDDGCNDSSPLPVDSEQNDDECFILTQSTDCSTGLLVFTECDQTVDKSVEPVIEFHCYNKNGDGLYLRRLLNQLKPRNILFYDIDATAIRQVEVYQAMNNEYQIRVLVIALRHCVEEQAYLTGLRKEKQAFEFLIREKSTWSTPIEQDGRIIQVRRLDMDKPVAATDDHRKAASSVDDEQPGQRRQQPLIIVDTREFRSDLPLLLHRRAIDIEPVTLQIGDYILTPELCVERKSVNDLIGSLNSGRLYQQVLAMTRHYAKPVLLIEFSQKKGFGFLGGYFLSKDIEATNITSRLQLLTLHFPKLRIVWSPSPYDTAKLFDELKEGKEQPDVSAAVLVGQTDGSHDEDKYNAAIRDFVSKLPGVTTQNIYNILNNGRSLQHLLTLSQEHLENLLENSSNSESLYNALHTVLGNPNPTTAQFAKPATKFRARKKPVFK